MSHGTGRVLHSVEQTYRALQGDGSVKQDVALGILQQIPGDDVARLVVLGGDGDAAVALDSGAFGVSELVFPHAAREVGCRGDAEQARRQRYEG